MFVDRSFVGKSQASYGLPKRVSMEKEINLPEERIFSAIHVIRKQKIMLDADLAELYGVETKVLNQAVKRNQSRFPEDFMFQLTQKEWDNLKSQNVTSRWGGRRTPPFAFTEQGVAMLSSVLNSKQAIAVNIHIMRVFVKMRRFAANYEELMDKIHELQQSDSQQSEAIKRLYEVFRELIEPLHKNRPQIGYRQKGKD